MLEIKSAAGAAVITVNKTQKSADPTRISNNSSNPSIKLGTYSNYSSLAHFVCFYYKR